MAACATDLARKKILPTIFNLWRRKLLPRDLVLFGYARDTLDDERFRRTWRYYLLSSAASFRVRNLQLFQIVFSRTGRMSLLYRATR